MSNLTTNLSPALQLIEFVFENYDRDGAKAIMFSELQRLLAVSRTIHPSPLPSPLLHSMVFESILLLLFPPSADTLHACQKLALHYVAR